MQLNALKRSTNPSPDHSPQALAEHHRRQVRRVYLEFLPGGMSPFTTASANNLPGEFYGVP